MSREGRTIATAAAPAVPDDCLTGTLPPLAIGFNKAIFQREPAPFDANQRFFETFPQVCSKWAHLRDVPVPLFVTSLRMFFDVARSTPSRLTATDAGLAARIEPLSTTVTGAAGTTVDVPVKVTNLSPMALSVALTVVSDGARARFPRVGAATR